MYFYIYLIKFLIFSFLFLITIIAIKLLLVANKYIYKGVRVIRYTLWKLSFVIFWSFASRKFLSNTRPASNPTKWDICVKIRIRKFIKHFGKDLISCKKYTNWNDSFNWSKLKSVEITQVVEVGPPYPISQCFENSVYTDIWSMIWILRCSKCPKTELDRYVLYCSFP